MTHFRIPVVALMVLCLALAGSLSLSSGEDAVKKLSLLPFGKWYEPVKYEVAPKGIRTLPKKLDSLADSPALKALKISTSDICLASNGFVLSDAIEAAELPEFYEQVAAMGIPTLITADSMLHFHHALFDDMLAQIEEKTLSKSITDTLTDLRTNFTLSDVKTEEAAAFALAHQYLSVALALLSGEASSNDPLVKGELELIAKHQGFAPSPLFTYKEDYSQYVPRGHYTRTEGLSRYFRAMMWLGRLTFLTRGKLSDGDDALVDLATAKKQILTALNIAARLEKSKFRPQFDSIYEVTAFFVGYSDDLTAYDYLAIARKIIQNDRFTDIYEQPVYLKFLQEVLRAAPPAIYSGTGNYVNNGAALNGDPQPDALAKALSATTGMRLMGQRFVPDAYIHGKLVYPTVGAYTGDGLPSTGAPDRTFPSSLDIMRVLGSTEAAAIERGLTLDSYKGFDEELNRLTKEFSGLTQEDWHRNLYLGWLNSLTALFPDKPGQGYQPFQTSPYSRTRLLNSALGSWTSLRHDTILYVKQPYTMLKGMPVELESPAVYVEPEPELYARLIALNRQMAKGLVELGVIAPDDMKQSSVYKFTDLLQSLLDVSILELEGRPMTKEQTELLLGITKILKRIKTPTGDFSTEIVADVHTDATTSRVLEVATGPMIALVVVWMKEDGTLDVAVGPNYTWYEFAQPMNDRLTDDKWREMLKKEPQKLPTWMEPLYMGAKVNGEGKL